MTNFYNPRFCGKPLAPTNTSSYPMVPSVGMTNTFTTTETHFMVSDLSWYASKATNYLDAYATHLYNTPNDVLFVKNTLNVYLYTFWSGSTADNTLLLSNGRYYLCTNTPTAINTTSGNGAVAFDMGTSEPDFS